MKVTNKFDLPLPLVTLAGRQYYSKGASQYSVTEVLSPPRVRRLREQHDAEMEQDVSDMLWPLLGSALHVVMERGQTDGWISEERLTATVDGVTISGAIDLQQVTPAGINIIDYKFTSAWSVMNDKREWEEQLNLYAWLAETVKGKRVNKLQICAFIRDFSRHDNREGYPAAPIHLLDIPLWDKGEALALVKKRLEAHQESKVSHDFGEALPECSPEERWMSETTYAVRREGRKTAIRVFKDVNEAIDLSRKENGYVETRLGEPKRCTGNFCGVSQWCSQHLADASSRTPASEA